MLHNFGMGELLVVLLIVLLVFGARRLPQLGESLGKAIKGLKRGLASDDDIDVAPKEQQVESESSARSLSAEQKVSDAEVVDRK